jgi:uncharacterized protein YndB with AHSA1/START domain
MSTTTSTTTQVYRVYIKATPQAIWDAITKPEWTNRYGYQGFAEFDMRPGGAFRSRANEEGQAAGMPEIVVEGEVIEVDPPHKLVQTWRPTWLDEPPTRLTYEISEGQAGISSLTVIHELEGAPQTAAQTAGAVEGAGGGWAEVLSDLKTLLETGKSMHA